MTEQEVRELLGERIRGQDDLRAFRAAFPDPPTIQPRRLIGAGDV